MKRLLVNDILNSLGERTLWNSLQDWFDLEFVGGDYTDLAAIADKQAGDASLIIRSASWFPPMEASSHVPTIGLLIEILRGRKRAVQDAVIRSCQKVVAISAFTQYQYSDYSNIVVIPLPVDFDLFKPASKPEMQQALDLPANSVCWIGASQGDTGHIKGFDIFMKIVSDNSDISFVGIFKDAAPQTNPPNLRTYSQLPQEELVRVINACGTGLCTSRLETQHLAGIEMGACGLPMIAPPVGAYWQREDMPGILVDDEQWNKALRNLHMNMYNPDKVRDYWFGEFDKSVVKQQWAGLISEVESG